jgi:hypothetical protein
MCKCFCASAAFVLSLLDGGPWVVVFVTVDADFSGTVALLVSASLPPPFNDFFVVVVVVVVITVVVEFSCTVVTVETSVPRLLSDGAVASVVFSRSDASPSCGALDSDFITVSSLDSVAGSISCGCCCCCCSDMDDDADACRSKKASASVRVEKLMYTALL